MGKWSLFAAAAVLAGCTVIKPISSQGTLILMPQITAGRYGTLTQIDPYTQSSIHHLILKIYTYDGTEHDQGIQKTLYNADLNKAVVFTNLKANTTYRIKAFAYASTDASQLISTSDANSYTDIPVVTNDQPAIGSLKVKLIDRDFNGQATSSAIAVTPGGYSFAGSELMQIYNLGVVTTLAGVMGSSGISDGTGSSARFTYPMGFATDAAGNIYEGGNDNAVRKITPAGVVTTLAGLPGASAAQDGTGTAARFSLVYGLSVDASGNVYVGDEVNNAIRKVTPDGVVTTLAGALGASGSVDATGTNARFYYPLGTAVDAAGNVYVADGNNHAIRKITPAGVVTTFAGLMGSAGSVDGTGAAARFIYPTGIALDKSGNLFVADCGNNAIRKVSPAGVVTTLAGSLGIVGSVDGTGAAARFHSPKGVTVDDCGTVYVADTYNYAIRRITPQGVVTTFAGTLNATGSVDATGTAARFNIPCGITVDSQGRVYVADTYNHAIRRIL